MALVVPNNGEGDALRYFVNNAAPQDLVLRLYQNNITPSELDTAATFTEFTAPGYAALDLPGASWSITEGDPSFAAYAQQTFNLTGAGDCYGYYLTRKNSGRLALAERFASVFSIPSGGGSIKITPRVEAA